MDTKLRRGVRVESPSPGLTGWRLLEFWALWSSVLLEVNWVHSWEKTVVTLKVARPASEPAVPSVQELCCGTFWVQCSIAVLSEFTSEERLSERLVGSLEAKKGLQEVRAQRRVGEWQGPGGYWAAGEPGAYVRSTPYC